MTVFEAGKWCCRSALLSSTVSDESDVYDLRAAHGGSLLLCSGRRVKNGHGEWKSDNLGTGAAWFLNNSLHPTWWCAEEECTAPCGTPVWSAPWHEPLSIMLPNCDTVATTHVLLASASTPLQTQLPLHRRGGLLREAHQGLSEQIVLQNTVPCRAFLRGQWPERREEKSASSLKTGPKWNLRQQGFPFENGSTVLHCQMSERLICFHISKAWV